MKLNTGGRHMKIGLSLMLVVGSSLMLAGSHVPAAALSYQTGGIDLLSVRDSEGLLWVHLDKFGGGPFARAPCAANTTYWIIPDETTEAGRLLYDSLLDAELAHRFVAIHGKGTCNRWPDGEDIDYVEILDRPPPPAPFNNPP